MASTELVEVESEVEIDLTEEGEVSMTEELVVVVCELVKLSVDSAPIDTLESEDIDVSDVAIPLDVVSDIDEEVVVVVIVL